MREKLTDTLMRSLAPREARYHVGDSVVRGLRIRVSPDGLRTFSVVYRAPTGKVQTYTIGAYPELSLAQAREKAAEIKARARLGQDAQSERIEARAEMRRALDFEALSKRFIEFREPNLAESTLAEYRRMVSTYVSCSPIARVRASDLRRPDVREFLEGIARIAPVMSNRVFQFVRAVCRWAVREELIETNPCEGLQRPRKERSRERALRDEEIATLWKAAEDEAAEQKRPTIAGVVKALLLLGQRSTETAEMRWQDVDLKARTWTIPAEYRKGDRLHVVPLPPTLVRIIENLRTESGGTPRVFDGVSEANAERDWWGPIRERAIRAGAEHFTKHDLRRTCATGCGRLGASPFIVSRILGHATQPGAVRVTGIYDRFDRLPEMAAALGAWAGHVGRITRWKTRRAGRESGPTRK